MALDVRLEAGTAQAQEPRASWVALLRPGRIEDGRARYELVHGGPASTLEVAEREGCSVLFDGRLYERDPLTPAAETVLDAYLADGERAFGAIKGVFSCAVADRRSGTLFLVRDRMGLFPIFYADSPEGVLVSPSIDSLVRHAGVSGAPNVIALVDYVAQRWNDPGETYVDAIRRVPAAHVLRVEPSGARRLVRYWDPVPDDPFEWIDDDELERFEELLNQAVRRALDVGPVGIYLSGGLDSVSVAAIAADEARVRGMPPPHALSMIFPAEANEEPVQRAVAAELGLPITTRPIEDPPGGTFETGLETSEGWPVPLLTIWQPAYARMGREGARAGCSVLMSGAGGDEWLCVTPVYGADLIKSLQLPALVKLVRSHKRSYRLTTMQVMRNALWRYGAKPVLERAGGNVLRAVAPGRAEASRTRRVESWMPDWVAPDPRLRRASIERTVAAWPRRRGSFYGREMREALDHPLVALEFEENFESSRRIGLPVSPPFLDADLVHFLVRVRPEALSRGGRTKGLVRDTLDRRFPGLGFKLQKKVSAAKLIQQMNLEQGTRAWTRMGGVPALAELGIVDADGVERMVEKLVQERPHEAGRIWELLSVEAWLRPRI
jgi:asparagine synthetase B (glutamine-hydrolysing)